MNLLHRILFPPEGATTASQVDYFAAFMLAVSAFFTILIAALIIYFAIRYRRTPTNRIPTQVPGSLPLEITWTVIPFLLTLIMFVGGTRIFVSAHHPPAGAMEVFVVGKQWMWKVQHPEGRREINAIHVPLGRPIKLIITSQDVIHDFGLPGFRTKQDAVPGLYTSEWFTPTRLGQYHLFCDQFCGSKHADMVGTVYVMTQAEYTQWLAGDPGAVPSAQSGRKLFEQYGCATCHGQYAPTLAGLYGRTVEVVDESGNRRQTIADEAYLRESILYPNQKLVTGYPNRMPSFKSSLSEEQIYDLIQYIKSLSGGADTGPYKGAPTGPATQPVDSEQKIQNPPFSNYRANQ
jgi:cytochrome c oxidase subunit II